MSSYLQWGSVFPQQCIFLEGNPSILLLNRLWRRHDTNKQTNKKQMFCCMYIKKRAAGEKLDSGGYSGSTYLILSQI